MTARETPSNRRIHFEQECWLETSEQENDALTAKENAWRRRIHLEGHHGARDNHAMIVEENARRKRIQFRGT